MTAPIDKADEDARKRRDELLTRANRSWFERECKAAGVDTASAVSPSLAKILAGAAAVLLITIGHARADNSEWFAAQRNKHGDWCCDKSDGHRYDGSYSFEPDGSVTLHLKSGPHRIEPFMVLTTPNPTGHAIWWYTSNRDYCFAPGSLI